MTDQTTAPLRGWRRWILMLRYILRDPYDVVENQAMGERLVAND